MQSASSGEVVAADVRVTLAVSILDAAIIRGRWNTESL
jgi:hypothetical protein